MYAMHGTDGDAAISLVEAATAAGVDQYVMVTSLGTGKWGWPAGARQRLLTSLLPYELAPRARSLLTPWHAVTKSVPWQVHFL